MKSFTFVSLAALATAQWSCPTLSCLDTIQEDSTCYSYSSTTQLVKKYPCDEGKLCNMDYQTSNGVDLFNDWIYSTLTEYEFTTGANSQMKKQFCSYSASMIQDRLPGSPCFVDWQCQSMRCHSGACYGNTEGQICFSDENCGPGYQCGISIQDGVQYGQCKQLLEADELCEDQTTGVTLKCQNGYSCAKVNIEDSRTCQKIHSIEDGEPAYDEILCQSNSSNPLTNTCRSLSYVTQITDFTQLSATISVDIYTGETTIDGQDESLSGVDDTCDVTSFPYCIPIYNDNSIESEQSKYLQCRCSMNDISEGYCISMDNDFYISKRSALLASEDCHISVVDRSDRFDQWLYCSGNDLTVQAYIGEYMNVQNKPLVLGGTYQDGCFNYTTLYDVPTPLSSISIDL